MTSRMADKVKLDKIAAGAAKADSAAPDGRGARDGSRDIAAGRHVLELESAALSSLAETLDDTFHAAVEILRAVRGRVTVTGMGKSGHVARKIAATLASTGTPAQYVHPGEASHGDMGMITTEDAIVALSNSGETQELRDLLLHAKRYSIPLIAITAKPESTLAEHADVALILPGMPEAGTLGLAPTTSTTMSLALGDALAVAILEQKLERNEFSSADFRMLHPGGKLGQQLLRVSDLMHGGGEMPLVDADSTIGEALLLTAGRRFGCIGVQDGAGRLIGMITNGDLRRNMSDDLLSRPVVEVMNRDPVVYAPDTLAVEALSDMNARPINAAFIVENGKPVGVLELHDFLHAGLV